MNHIWEQIEEAVPCPSFDLLSPDRHTEPDYRMRLVSSLTVCSLHFYRIYRDHVLKLRRHPLLPLHLLFLPSVQPFCPTPLIQISSTLSKLDTIIVSAHSRLLFVTLVPISKQNDSLTNARAVLP